MPYLSAYLAVTVTTLPAAGVVWSAVTAHVAAGPATPVALNDTRPPMPATVAVRTFSPAVVPSVQLPTAATPDASVTALSPVTEPPPAATAKTTVAPEMGIPPASVTSTLGGVATAVPAIAV